MKDIPELFGSMVFNDRVMKARLPEDVYRALKSTIAEGRPLDIEIANAVAAAMRDWAIEKGATHYTHWFQPLNGITAEKHDSFIVPDGTDGVVMEFSGKNLVKGESDASSFPSGGLRATFEARGYTAWDPTSYAFIKDDTLCIPTAYCSYGGAALDKKTPLLRSMEAVEKQAMRVMRLFGDGCRRVQTSVGAEQEYFHIDRSVYDRRPDLISCGRTLVGARPNKGQELDDHYYGAINPRVSCFMKELDEELWRLGVPAKTEHKEVAPAQHELAPVYATTNIATDHNQLTMEFLKRIADRHGMVCLLHEKPFAGVNGSGKHNNWSIGTDAGENLLSPGETPSQNARFLLMLTAMIRAVDEHQDLLRISTVSAGNDHRLGGSEAPPTVISVFLGDQLTMELMQRIARKHGMVCLLHEKPFAGVNGSGKHNNWSITTNTGINGFEPGETPAENAQFLLFLCAVIQAVDDYQDLMRICVASAGNDHRLGAAEAPPAIVSIFLGDELSSILDAIEKGAPYGAREKELFKVGVHVLPKFPKDTTDRNRTSPFAFTGNKFEFRMLGASQSISGPNVVLNTAVAESLRQYADRLEQASDFDTALHDLIQEVIRKHRRIIFNGNGYGEEWTREAERRGLCNYHATPDCTPEYLAPKNVELFTRHRIYSDAELRARCEMKLDAYCKVIRIEALTMLDMLWKDILPAVSACTGDLARAANEKKALLPAMDVSYEAQIAGELSALMASAAIHGRALENAMDGLKNPGDTYAAARYYRDRVFPAMLSLRDVVDGMELRCGAKYWPYPSYGEILFSVK